MTGGKDESWYEPIFITTNGSTYSSGETPKYAVGQQVKILCVCCTEKVMVTCEVTGISDTRNCGWIYKEFSYTLVVRDSIGKETMAGDQRGATLTDVYESCLYEI